MKKLISLFLAVLMLLSMVACANDETAAPDEPKEPEVTTVLEPLPPREVEPKEPLTLIESPVTEEDFMNNAKITSIVSMGNTYRLKAAMEKAKLGEDVTLAYIGGSITYGDTIADRSLNWANRSYEYFASTFGNGDNVHYVNAGVNGTPSAYGALRVNDDVLVHNPDVVFIEFAVNDASAVLYSDSFECLIRECLTHESKPAVVIVFASAGESWWSGQPWQKRIAENYDVSMISYGDAVTYLFKNNVTNIKKFTSDNVHPTTEGHGIVAEFVNYFFDEAYRLEAPTEDTVLPERLYEGLFQSAVMVRQQTYTPESMGSWKNGTGMYNGNGWIINRDGTNEPIVFEFSGKNAYICYASVTNDEYGTAVAKVFFNGTEVATVELLGKGTSWQACCSTLLYSADAVGEYRIEVSMKTDPNAKFEIHGMAYTEEQFQK